MFVQYEVLKSYHIYLNIDQAIYSSHVLPKSSCPYSYISPYKL